MLGAYFYDVLLVATVVFVLSAALVAVALFQISSKLEFIYSLKGEVQEAIDKLSIVQLHPDDKKLIAEILESAKKKDVLYSVTYPAQETAKKRKK